MPDEYRPGATKAPAPNPYIKIQNYTSNHVLGNPYIFDARALMKGNWYIRARYLWHVAEWMHSLPEFPKDRFMVHHFRGAIEEQYTLPFYRHNSPPTNPANPGRNYMNWPVRYNLRQPPALAGDVVCDSVLYMIGPDEYATQILPDLINANRGIARVPGDEIDGVLVVMVRIAVEITNATATGLLNAAQMQTVTARIYSRIETSFNNNFNGRYTAAFTPSAAASPAVTFRRCLVHLVPCFITKAPGGAWPAEYGASPQHLTVRIRHLWAGPQTFTSTSPPGPKSMDIPLPGLGNAQLDPVANAIFGRCCQTVSIDPNPANPGSYNDPTGYISVVRSVMGAAVAAPVIT